VSLAKALGRAATRNLLNAIKVESDRVGDCWACNENKKGKAYTCSEKCLCYKKCADMKAHDEEVEERIRKVIREALGIAQGQALLSPAKNGKGLEILKN